MTTDVPPQLERVLTKLDNVAAPVRTRIARARETLERHPAQHPSAEFLQEAAASSMASAELRAVARAVAEGRTTWEKVATGAAGHLPEVAAFHTACFDNTRHMIESWPSEESDEPVEGDGEGDDHGVDDADADAEMDVEVTREDPW